MSGRRSDGLTGLVIAERALADPNLTRLDLAVLCWLGVYEDRYRHVCPSQAHLAEKTGASREWVSRSIAKLVKMGYVVKDGRQRRAIVYRLVGDDPDPKCDPVGHTTPPPKCDPVGHTTPPEVCPRGSQDHVTYGVTQLPEGTTNPPLPPLEGGDERSADACGVAAPGTPPTPPRSGGLDPATGVRPGEPTPPRQATPQAARQGGQAENPEPDAPAPARAIRHPEAHWKAWKRVRSTLKISNEAKYKSWIAGLKLISIERDEIIIRAEHTFAADYVTSNFGQRIEELFAGQGFRAPVKIIAARPPAWQTARPRQAAHA